MLPAPAVSADVGRHNLAVVLHAIAQSGPCSRGAIRERTGLVGGTVKTMVDELIARGLVSESGVAQGSRGRPRTLLELTGHRVRTIAADVSLTTLAAEVRDLAGDLLWSGTDDTGSEPGDVNGLVRVLAPLLDEAIAQADAPGSVMTEPVVIIPGLVESDSTIAAALDLGLGRTDLRTRLTAALRHRRELVLLNNGRLGALAEYAGMTAELRPQAMVYVHGAEGLGGGILLDGEIYSGAHGLAGEVGHICVDLFGPGCQCGARGCLELYAGMDALQARAGLTAGGLADTLQELLDRLAQGDPAALAAIDTAGRALAGAVGTMATYTDLDLVVLGGSLAPLYPWLEPPVTALIEARARVVPNFNPRVATAVSGHDGPLTGAWLHARNSILHDPSRVPRL